MVTKKTTGLSATVAPESAEQNRERSRAECRADNCPLPGVFGVSRDASLCRAHDGIEAHHWPAITDRVREPLYLAALTTAADLLNASSGDAPDPKIVARFVARFGSDFARMTRKYGLPDALRGKIGEEHPETARDYGRRVQKLLLLKVREGYERKIHIEEAVER